MLVISRKIGESFTIGDDITVVITEKHGKNGVRIGIEAPKDVKILRTELVDHDDIRALMGVDDGQT